MRVRRLREEDWEALRELRLRALEDAPYAFASTLERERDFVEDRWRTRAGRGWIGDNGATFFAEHEARTVGLASAFPDEDRPAVHLVAMWVDPSGRRLGAGTALIEAVVEWARDRGADEVALWVTETNRAAIALYERTGFEPTGERQPLPSDPALMERQMRRRL